MQDQNFDSVTYVEQMAALLDLPIRDEHIDGVVTNFERIRVIAEVVNQFTLSEEVEVAPVFEA